MPVYVRNSGAWKATSSVVGGGTTGGGGTGGTGGGTSSAGTLARPFSADSAWNSPFTGSEVWQTFSQLPKVYGFNTGSSGGTCSAYDIGNGSFDINVTIVNSSGGANAYRGYPSGTIVWRGVTGMTPSQGADQTMNVIWTSPANGLRYSLDLWMAVRNSDTSFTAQAFGVSCVDGVSGYVPGRSIGGKQLYAAGNGWGDHTPGDFNSAKAAGVTEAEASWLGGAITPWAIASGKIQFALACALPANLMGNTRYRPSVMPWHGSNGPLMQGMRIGFPGAPRSTVTGVPKMIVDAAMDYGIYVRDAQGWTGVLCYIEHSVDTSAWLGTLQNEMNKIGPYGKITTTLPAGVSPTV